MQLPLQIAYRGVEASATLEDHIRRKAALLERFSQHVTGCRVVLETPHRRHRQGKMFHVRIDLTVPGDELLVTREPSAHHAHEDAHVAIRDAFDAAVRQLEDYVRRRRQDVKTHEVPCHGTVSRLVPNDDHGFIATPDGRDIYFHRNSVVDGGGFDALRVGSEVRFTEERGDEGPQATTVHPIGKHHVRS
jgi:ribosomal subunit interface protein